MSDHKPFAAYATAIIMLMELVDGSALNTSLPQMALSFGVNPISLKVAITVYLLTLGLFIPASTWVADRFGAKNILLISAIGFVGASILCGLSTNVTMLIICRALQGFFGAFTMPVSRMVLIRIYKKNLLYAMTIMGSIITIGPMLGPLIGGTMTTYLSWRYIFFINVPIGICALILVLKFVPNGGTKDERYDFDWYGFLSLGLSIALLMFVLDTLMDHAISMNVKWGALGLAIVLCISYFFHARNKKARAVLDLQIFVNRQFSDLILLSVIIRLSTMGIMFLFPLYLQMYRGFSALQAGIAFMAFIVPVWLVKRAIKLLLTKLGLFVFMLITIVLMMLGYLICALVFSHFSLTLYLATLALLGLCFGSFTTLGNSSIYNVVSEKEIGAVSVIISAIIQLSSAFAVAWVATLLASFSGVKNVDVHSLITEASFSYVMLLCAFGMLVGLVYLCYCRYKRGFGSVQVS